MRRYFYKTFKILLLFVLLILPSGILSGCFFNKKPSATTNCYPNHVTGCNAGTVYACDNSSDMFVYKIGNEGKGIYSYSTDSLLIPIEDDSLCYMAATNNIIYYSTKLNGGILRGFSILEHNNVYDMNDYEVFGMKAFCDDAFVTVVEKGGVSKTGKKENNAYSILMFEDGQNCYNLNQIIQAGTDPNLAIIKQQIDYSYYTFKDYTIVVSNTLNTEYPQIVYIEKNSFKYSCLPYNTYIYDGNEVYCINERADFLPEISNGYGGINAAHVSVNGSKCIFIAQYSKGTWEYQFNPEISFKVANSLCSYDIKTKEFSTIYEAEKDEQIASFSYDGNVVYTLRSDGVYKNDLTSGESEQICEDPYTDSDVIGKCSFYFDQCKNKLFIFSGEGGKDSPYLVEVIDN